MCATCGCSGTSSEETVATLAGGAHGHVPGHADDEAVGHEHEHEHDHAHAHAQGHAHSHSHGHAHSHEHEHADDPGHAHGDTTAARTLRLEQEILGKNRLLA